LRAGHTEDLERIRGEKGGLASKVAELEGLLTEALHEKDKNNHKVDEEMKMRL
jgi:hypothetical protein